MLENMALQDEAIRKASIVLEIARCALCPAERDDHRETIAA
jgi:hypothetical protein